MKYTNCFLAAIDVVLGWDLPDAALADALTAHANLIDGDDWT